MKRVFGASTAVLLAGLVAAWMGMNHLLVTYVPGVTPIVLYMDAALVPKLLMIFCILVGIGVPPAILAGVIAALVRQASAARIGAMLLSVGGWAIAGLGALGAGYSELITRQAMASTGVSDLAITAPSHAEALLTLAVGLFFGLMGQAGALVVVWLSSVRPPRAIAA